WQRGTDSPSPTKIQCILMYRTSPLYRGFNLGMSALELGCPLRKAVHRRFRLHSTSFEHAVASPMVWISTVEAGAPPPCPRSQCSSNLLPLPAARNKSSAWVPPDCSHFQARCGSTPQALALPGQKSSPPAPVECDARRFFEGVPRLSLDCCPETHP